MSGGPSYQGGVPAVTKQGIFDSHVTQQHRVGEVMRLNDGRAFRYAYNGGAVLAVGKLVTGLACTQVAKSVLPASVAIGSYELTVVTAAADLNMAEGYMNVESGTGLGYSYKIKSSKANAATATSTDIVLYDPIQVALVSGGTSVVTLHYNPWYGVVLQASMALPVVGVPPIAVPINYYFWCQTWGPVAVYTGQTPAISMRLVSSDSTLWGAVTDDAAASFDQILGYNMGDTGANTNYNLIYLTIAP